MLRKYLFAILFVSWMVFVTLLSLFSFSVDTEEEIWVPHLDKMVHFTFYFVMTVLGVLFLREKSKTVHVANQTIGIVFFFAITYGAIIEILQYLMPFDRSAEIWDFLANTIGALLGGLLIQKYLSRIRTLK